jgi:hypothetical protein
MKDRAWALAAGKEWEKEWAGKWEEDVRPLRSKLDFSFYSKALLILLE